MAARPDPSIFTDDDLRIRNYINGELHPATSGSSFDNIEPATGKVGWNTAATVALTPTCPNIPSATNTSSSCPLLSGSGKVLPEKEKESMLNWLQQDSGMLVRPQFWQDSQILEEPMA